MYRYVQTGWQNVYPNGELPLETFGITQRAMVDTAKYGTVLIITYRILYRYHSQLYSTAAASHQIRCEAPAAHSATEAEQTKTLVQKALV